MSCGISSRLPWPRRRGNGVYVVGGIRGGCWADTVDTASGILDDVGIGRVGRLGLTRGMGEGDLSSVWWRFCNGFLLATW